MANPLRKPFSRVPVKVFNKLPRPDWNEEGPFHEQQVKGWWFEPLRKEEWEHHLPNTHHNMEYAKLCVELFCEDDEDLEERETDVERFYILPYWMCPHSAARDQNVPPVWENPEEKALTFAVLTDLVQILTPMTGRTTKGPSNLLRVTVLAMLLDEDKMPKPYSNFINECRTTMYEKQQGDDMAEYQIDWRKVGAQKLCSQICGTTQPRRNVRGPVSLHGSWFQKSICIDPL